jgi:NADH-quinone oxidoreductase subunit E
MKKPFDLNAPYQPESFVFSKANQARVHEVISLYPKGFQQSAVMPLLDLAQRQVAAQGEKSSPPYGGWIPRAAMDEIARILEIAPIKVYEVASFYSMYNLAPVGKYLIQVCGTTPCWLCGAAQIIAACEQHLGIKMNQTTPDGLFTLMEVECLGACVNAPMVQINDDYYEDLTPQSVVQLLKDLSAGRAPKAGSLTGRKASMAASGPTSLQEHARRAGIAVTG